LPLGSGVAGCNRDQKEKGGGAVRRVHPTERRVSLSSPSSHRLRSSPAVFADLAFFLFCIITDLLFLLLYRVAIYSGAVTSFPVFHLLSFDLLCLLPSIAVLWDYLKFNYFPIFAILSFFFCLSDSQEGKTATTFMLDLSEIQIPGVAGTLLTCLPPLCCSVVAFSLLWQTDLVESPLLDWSVREGLLSRSFVFLIASMKLLERIQVLAVYEWSSMCAEKFGLSFRFLRPPGRFFCIPFWWRISLVGFWKVDIREVQEKEVCPVRGNKF